MARTRFGATTSGGRGVGQSEGRVRGRGENQGAGRGGGHGRGRGDTEEEHMNEQSWMDPAAIAMIAQVVNSILDQRAAEEAPAHMGTDDVQYEDAEEESEGGVNYEDVNEGIRIGSLSGRPRSSARESFHQNCKDCEVKDYDGKVKFVQRLEKKKTVIDVSGHTSDQRVSYVVRSETMTEELVHCGTPTTIGSKRKEVSEASGSKKIWRQDEKRPNKGKGFVDANAGKGDDASFLSKCGRCNYHHTANQQCITCFNCKKIGHKVSSCREPIRGACFECGAINHYRDTCPQRFGQQIHPNQFRTTRNNQVRGSQVQAAEGRAYVLNAAEVRNNPNVNGGTFLFK